MSANWVAPVLPAEQVTPLHPAEWVAPVHGAEQLTTLHPAEWVAPVLPAQGLNPSLAANQTVHRPAVTSTAPHSQVISDPSVEGLTVPLKVTSERDPQIQEKQTSETAKEPVVRIQNGGFSSRRHIANREASCSQ